MTQITDAGFVRTRLDERLADLKAAARAIFGDDIEIEDESPDGQLLAVFAERISDLDQLAEDLYNARSPAGARGAALYRLGRLNGVTRTGAEYSTVPVTLSGTPGVVVPARSLIANDLDETAVFETTTDLTIGDAGTVTGSARSVAPGDIPAPAGHLTLIKTVIRGWTGATNASDATAGTLGETDPEFRIRRARSVAMPSQGLLDGLQAELLEVDNVLRVRVFENETDAPKAMTGGGSLPPHSIECIVQGGAAADIADVIWRRKASGVTLVGSQTADVTDSQGNTHTMRWNAPVDANVYVVVNLAAAVSAATKSTIKAAIAEWGEANSDIGKPVLWSQIFTAINGVALDLSVDTLYIGTAPAPTTQANIVVAYNALARWDASRITVTDPP